jgi:deazaflavin-dependent oxidoreductase (nitroreductase family)
MRQEISMFDWLFKLVSKIQVVVFRSTNGKLMANMRSMPILLLSTVGRKSGRMRTTPLMYLRDGESYVITASNSGSDRHPAWFYNLQASPQVEIEIPGKRLQATASVATPDERDQLWPILVAKAPFYDGYRKKTSRSIPMVFLKPR